MDIDSLETIRAIIDKYALPSQPEVIVAIQKEASNEYPDINKLVSLISTDVSLSAAVLQTINSPFFSLAKKVTSIHQAVVLLGASRTIKVVNIIGLRQSLLENTRGVNAFWTNATDVACLSAYLSTKMGFIFSDEAFATGMFRDCGIIILLQCEPEYKNILQLTRGDHNVNLREREIEMLGIDHAMVGYCLATSWFLPEVVTRATLNHHHLFYPDHNDMEDYGKQCQIVAINQLAQHLSLHIRYENPYGQEVDPWPDVQDDVLDILDSSEQELNEIKEELDNDLHNVFQQIG